MPPAVLRLTSLKNICLAQGTPYHEASYDDTDGAVIQRRFRDVDVVQIPSPYIYCGLVREANVFANSFVHLRNNECVFQGQSLHTSPDLGHFNAYAEAFMGSHNDTLFQSFIEEECIFLGGMPIDPDASGPGFHLLVNFERFIGEFLVRMALFDLYGLTKRLPLVVYDELPEVWVDFICMAGGSRDRLIRVPAARMQAYRNVWIASSARYYDQRGAHRLWNAGVHWLRYKMLQSIGGAKLSPRRRIYIRPGKMFAGRVVNEDEIIPLLERYGVEPLELAALPAREQVEIISGAELIVATADAGAALSWFAPEHCANIVLTPQGNTTGLWGGAGVAALLRQPYEQLECAPIERSPANASVDLKVDPDGLRNLVEAALALIDSSHVGDAIRI